MFERYTEAARRALFFSRYEASRLGCVSIEPEQLLLGWIKDRRINIAANSAALVLAVIANQFTAQGERKTLKCEG